jgi:hypothetical protein
VVVGGIHLAVMVGIQVAMEEEEVTVEVIQVVVVVGIQVVMLVEGVQVAMVADIQVVVECITMLVVVECLLETEVVKHLTGEEEDLERLVEEEEEEEDSERLVEEEEVKQAMAVAAEDFLRPMEVLLLEAEVRLSLAAAAAVSQVLWVVAADHVHQSHHSVVVVNLTTLLLESLALLAPDMACTIPGR